MIGLSVSQSNGDMSEDVGRKSWVTIHLLDNVLEEKETLQRGGPTVLQKQPTFDATVDFTPVL